MPIQPSLRLFTIVLVSCASISHAVAALPAPESPAPVAPVPPAQAASTTELPEVVVTPSRTGESLWDTPATVTLLDQETILRHQALTPTAMLQEQPGVFAVSVASQGSPVLRGQIGNRVLYLWDGVRINNGALFAGPNGYFNQFPIGAVDRMEVILGSGAVEYGGDAIGGVINVIPKKAAFSSQRFSINGDVDVRYGSNADENLESFDLNISSQRVALSAGLTWQNVGNYHGPEFGAISPTSYWAFGGYADLAIKVFENQVLSISWLGNEREDVSSYIQSKLNPNGIPRVYNPLERRNIAKIDYTATDLGALSSELKFYGYFQEYNQVGQRRIENFPTFTNTTTNTRQDVFGVGVQNTTVWGPAHFTYGVDFRRESLSSSLDQFLLNESTGLGTDLMPSGKTPDGTYDVLGAFLSGEYRPVKPWLVTAGVRYENTHIDSNPRDTDAIPNAGYTIDDLKLNKSWQSVTWNVGTIVGVTRSWDLVGNISTAFRAPDYSDLFSSGTPVFSSKTASIPSPLIDPEKSITYEVGTRYHSDRITGSATAYTTQLYDTVETVNAGTVTIPGQGTFIANSRDNSGTAYVRGVELSLAYHPAPGWTLFGNATYTYGQDTALDAPLRFIPPLFGTVGIRYESPSKRWWVEATEFMAGTLYRHAPQDELDAGFSKDPAFGSPNTTNNPPYRDNFTIPGYAITNLRAGARLWERQGRALDVTLVLSNLFDHKYREAYAQQELVAPGFGATINVKLTF
jgi:outer membrane receptor protein involved in Fe transport